MQAITKNRITQAKHGQYNAVDYSWSPDPDFYAPEDGKVTLIDVSGDCGNRLWLDGNTGRHGFCHIEKYYVKVGQVVKRGQKLAKMGYTGLTIPKGPDGRHVHQVLFRSGKYVYPPDYINEGFIKLGEEDMFKGKTAEQHYKEAKEWKRRATNLEKAYEKSKAEIKKLKVQVGNSKEFNAFGNALAALLVKLGFKRNT